MNKIKEILRNNSFYEIVFICAVCFSFILWMAVIFKNGYNSSQFNMFYMRCGDFFGDMLNLVGVSSRRDVYDNVMTPEIQKIYPALPYILTYIFSRLVDMTKYWETKYFLSIYQEPFFLLIFFLFLFAILLMFYECMRSYKKGNSLIKVGCAVSCIFSFPIIQTIERANLVLVAALCLMFFIFNYDSKYRWIREAALLALAAAFAFKVTPAVYGILLLYDKKIAEAVRSAVYALILGIVPFLFFKGGLDNIRLMFRNIQAASAINTDAAGTPLYACFLSLGMEASDTRRMIIRIATYVICICIILAGFYGSHWEKVMGIGIVLMILPMYSSTYCILYLIPSMIMFLNEEEHRMSDILVLFSFLLCMYHILWPGRPLFDCHLGIIILTVSMAVRGIENMHNKRNKKIETKNKT